MNQDTSKIEVMHDNKFIEINAKNLNSWFKTPRIYLISLFIIIILTALFLLSKNNLNSLFKKSLPSKQTNKTNIITTSATPSSALNQVYIGKLKDLTANKISLESTKSGQLSFNLKPSTIYYQCSDFNDINKCQVNQSSIKTATQVKVFVQSQEVLYVLYK